MSPTRPLPPSVCPKCGGKNMTVTAKSETPPMTYVRCAACGYMTAVVSR
jgi:predicted RNA-binding Zn-ribbon protein involved in translation (DUF1610 family)